MMLKYIYNKLCNIRHAIRLRRQYWKEWDTRINDVVSSADNLEIPRVAKAGEIVGNYQIMHNGLKIITGSYYGAGITRMLKENRGVHEPQEEKVFQEVLKTLRNDAVIIELGAYWSFYSMWFLTLLTKGSAFLYEPEQKNLEYGMANFKLNQLKGDFNLGFIGSEHLAGYPPTYSVDYIVESKKIDFIDVLHCDIQGYEFEMLIGAINTINEKRIGYFFISTHSTEIHEKCLSYLKSKNFIIVSECNLENTCSVDGLIVAKADNFTGISKISVSKR